MTSAKPSVETSTDGQFVKSHHSVGNGNCVEVAINAEFVRVRDSKNRNGPVLVFTRDEWNAFRAGVGDGEFVCP